ncbi:MAG TPA: ABC transporter permease [Clostridiales bacterium]|nr:ABC transporter permease [Clostridiales bacterium]
MFTHIFINRLKVLLRDRSLIFWTLVFPIILGTFFNLALGNINSGEDFKSIKVAVVENEEYKKDEGFKETLKQVTQGENPLLDLTMVTNESEGKALLNESKVDGIIVIKDSIELIVLKSGINQNIVRNFLDSYQQTISTANHILSENPKAAYEFFDNVESREAYIKEVSLTSQEPDNVLNYFYTLIAMACFYASIFGNDEITKIQANLSPLAARINIAPVHKFKTLLASMSASFLISFLELLALLAFTIFILGVDYGTKTGLVVFTILIGSIAGVSFGALISATVKKDENLKIGILMGVTMTGSFLAGMMYQDMKYIISKYVPVLSYLNPVNLLTDALYSLYYYDTLTRYAINMMCLIVFIMLSWFVTYILIRRRKYASI